MNKNAHTNTKSYMHAPRSMHLCTQTYIYRWTYIRMHRWHKGDQKRTETRSENVDNNEKCNDLKEKTLPTSDIKAKACFVQLMSKEFNFCRST